MTTRIVVLAGRGRYEDPWHDHAAVAHEVALLFGEPGALGDRDVVGQVRSTWPDALDDLAPGDLLVVAAGQGRPDASFDGSDDDWRPFHDRLAAWAGAGGAVLALHAAANTFGDSPGWARVLGGRWVDGVSGHPPIGPATVTLRQGHPVTDGLAAVQVFDERYTALDVSPTAQVLGTTPDDDGADHPVLWVQEAHGGRTVYSALGHDLRSFASGSHRALLLRAAGWLLA